MLAALELPGDLVALLGLDEGHVVDDEHAGLGDAGHVLDGGLRRQPAVAAAVEGPGGAERAVPRAAAGELDGCGRVHHPDEVLTAAPAQVPGRKMIVQAVQHPGRTAGTVRGDRSGDLGQGPVRSRREQGRGAGLALALEHDVDGAFGVREDLLGHERDAVPADEDQAVREHGLEPLGQVHHLGHVGQVVEAEADRLRAEFGHLALQLRPPVDLQVDQPDLDGRRPAGPRPPAPGRAARAAGRSPSTSAHWDARAGLA